MPPTPSATANKKPWERACWREVGMKDPIASSLLVRTLPKSLAWPKTTSNMGAAASRISPIYRGEDTPENLKQLLTQQLGGSQHLISMKRLGRDATQQFRLLL